MTQEASDDSSTKLTSKVWQRKCNVIDARQPEQNWNNGKIKGYDLGVST